MPLKQAHMQMSEIPRFYFFFFFKITTGWGYLCTDKFNTHFLSAIIAGIYHHSWFVFVAFVLVCAYVNVFMRMCVCMYSVCLYVCVCMYVHAHVCMYVCICVYVHMYVCLSVSVYMCMYV